MTVKEILEGKGTGVVAADSHWPVFQAARMMVDRKVGSLVVLDSNGGLRGILTERDILHHTAATPDGPGLATVGELMSTDLMIGFPEDDLDSVSQLMTERRIRHLPIMDQGKMVGIVSIGDVVKARVRQAEIEVRFLNDYIAGRYPA